MTASTIASTLLSLLILGYLLFLKSYFSKKGENLAQREDVEALTRNVESVKSGIQFSLQASLSWHSEEHGALTDYYLKFRALLDGIVSAKISGNPGDKTGIDDLSARIDVLRSDYESSTSRMELFVDNQLILSQCYSLNLALLDIEIQVAKHLGQFRMIFLDMDGIDQNLSPDKFDEIYKCHMDRYVGMYGEFRQCLRDSYQKIFQLSLDHRKAITAHLKALMAQPPSDVRQ